MLPVHPQQSRSLTVHACFEKPNRNWTLKQQFCTSLSNSNIFDLIDRLFTYNAEILSIWRLIFLSYWLIICVQYRNIVDVEANSDIFFILLTNYLCTMQKYHRCGDSSCEFACFCCGSELGVCRPHGQSDASNDWQADSLHQVPEDSRLQQTHGRLINLHI